MSDSLQPYGLQHTRPPCSSPTPGVYSDSCPIESVMPSKHLILCGPLLLLPSVFLSIRVFSNEAALRIRWPKYWSFSFSISPSNEHPGLISFRMDWLDLLAVQGTLKTSSSTPHFKSINSSGLSFLYSPTLTSTHDYWENHSFDLDGPLLAKQCLCHLTCCLGYNLSSKEQASFNFMDAVIVCSDFRALPPKNKGFHCFHRFPIYLP